ncbi:MAG: hypothetical protein EOO50_08575 [Flavobacterium sp.]|uniref:hypothetical protein n=1 Tax=Flavobacterium sp. TaxID=239 RepID=UPI0011F9B995|nr:hypothetical protein [Flavobacterium sp.]RZJ66737.1 MAG: hypothetical protein EOO50_08575 [Flavobacterium sp.]
MFRKIFGYFLFLPAAFLTLAILVSIPKVVMSIADIFNSDDSAYASGYAFGLILGDVLIGLLAIYIWKKAFKFVKREPKRVESIDDIGTE